MPAQAGIQGPEGMDTGFRQYDGDLVPIRRPDHTCTCIFKGGRRGFDQKVMARRALE